jgi:glutamate/tyrosine decarboxylase-like PLP-dependent enzyme
LDLNSLELTAPCLSAIPRATMAVPPIDLDKERTSLRMNPLTLPEAPYREVFERVTQLALQYLASLAERPTFPVVSGSETETLFRRPLPENGLGITALDDILSVIEGARVGGPRFFGYVLGSGEPIAAAADLLASVLNQNVTAWRSAPSAAAVERVVVGWLAEAIGCEGLHGSLTGGGSLANLMALAMAREARLPANESGTQPELITKAPEVELLASVPLSAVCFRYRTNVGADALSWEILQAVIRRGKVFLSSASIRGQFALRACIVNHRTTVADVEQIVSEVTAVGTELTRTSAS